LTDITKLIGTFCYLRKCAYRRMLLYGVTGYSETAVKSVHNWSQR